MQNFELKARISDPDHIRNYLLSNDARFIGTDHQIDTYFAAKTGRLKLRSGLIEKSLIWYNRPDTAEAKLSDIRYLKLEETSDLLEVLSHALHIIGTVDKKREIYFIDNVKFHIDQVEDLGNFAEIEAIDGGDTLGVEHIKRQCLQYQTALQITSDQLISVSYIDLIKGVEHG